MVTNETLEDLMIRKGEKKGKQCHGYRMILEHNAFLPGVSSPITITRSDVVVMFYLI